MENVSSVLPTPTFFRNTDQLSTKKERGPKSRKAPPIRPIKSFPRFSRVFRIHQSCSNKALAVSFQNSDRSIASEYYDESLSETYFDQCFEMIGKLGTGSFGEVFKVRSKEDNKFYAVKKSKEPFRGESDRLRKLEEVKKYEQLPKHSRCIQFFKAWEEQEHLYIQTELCALSLSDFTEINHDIPEKLVWKYLVDLLLAVKHLHDHNLVHMDIKPDNIFISENGICKIGDFGLVLDLKKGNISDATEGDPKYLAPELMENKFTKAADIFSLGITILELACDLDLPMGGSAWHDLRKNRIPSEFMKHLSRDLKEVICQMMTASYKRRPSVDRILAHEAVRKVLNKGENELTFYQRLISSVKLAMFTVTAKLRIIMLWMSCMCLNLTSWNFKRDTMAHSKNDNLLCGKRPSSPSELVISDDEELDDNRPRFDIFNVSLTNCDDLPIHSTPVSIGHQNLLHRHVSPKPDLDSSSFSLNGTYNGSQTPYKHISNYAYVEDKLDITMLRKNLSELFDSIRDEN